MMILIIGFFITLAVLALSNFLEVNFQVMADAGIVKKIFIYLGNSIISGLIMGFTGAAMAAGIGDENAGEALVLLFGIGIALGFGLGIIFTGLWQYFAK
jgi:hypothetical protein